MEEKKISFVPSPVCREEYHIYDKDTGDKAVVDCFACILASVIVTQKIHVSLMYRMYKHKSQIIKLDRARELQRKGITFTGPGSFLS